MTRLPPGPHPRDMLRDLPRMLRDPLGYLLSCRERWGEVVAFPIARSTVWFVDDPEAVRHVLLDAARAYGKRTVQYDTLALVTGEGLLVADPPTWREHRRVLQPAFHRSTVPGIVAHAVAAAERVADGWAQRTGRDASTGDAVLDVDAAMMRASLEVVGATLLSTDLSGDADRLAGAVVRALDRVVARARAPWSPPVRVPTPGNLRLRRALRTLDDAVDGVVARRRREGGPDDDALALLLQEDLDDREVRDEVVTLVVAGHETVASALTWTWWLLAAHPAAQGRLQAELADVLGGRAPTSADWPDLPWTRAVVDEALRLYPPAWVVSRRSVAPDVLGGYDLPAGATVITSPWTQHRHPGVWTEPEAFDPRRWLGGERPRLGYLPFGAGQRLCIGREMALVESVALLAVLAQRFTVAPPHGPAQRAPRVAARVTLRPVGGMPLRVSPRGGAGTGVA